MNPSVHAAAMRDRRTEFMLEALRMLASDEELEE
jgi:hypothetical protein